MPESIIFKRPIDGALAMFERGCKVFPCLPNAKEPAVKEWQEWARTCTQKKIEEFGRANPTFNWGVACGESGIIVIDIDMKKGKNGKVEFEKLQAAQQKLPPTLTVRTPTGGLHYYFKDPTGGQIRNSAGLLGEGIDVRGAGGYVICPGSRIEENTYESLTDFSLN